MIRLPRGDSIRCPPSLYTFRKYWACVSGLAQHGRIGPIVVWMRCSRSGSSAMMADVEEIEVVVAHNERATVRVGDVFLKIDADQTRTDVEVEAMAMAPVPTPEILWRKPPVLALAALPGTALGRVAGGMGRGGCRRTDAA